MFEEVFSLVDYQLYQLLIELLAFLIGNLDQRITAKSLFPSARGLNTSLITDGLSDPFDETYHDISAVKKLFTDPDRGLGLELMVETDEPFTIDSHSGEHWLHHIIISATDLTLAEWDHQLGILQKFGMFFVACRPTKSLLNHIGSNGCVGLMGVSPSAGLPEFISLPNQKAALFTLTLLTADEYTYSMEAGIDGCYTLASLLQKTGNGHVSSLARPSVLAR